MDQRNHDRHMATFGNWRAGVYCKGALVVAAAWLAFSELNGATLQAQFGIPYGGQQQGRFIEPPRAILQVINDAERAITAGRLSDAVVQLGDLLAREVVVEGDADLAGQDFFLNFDEARTKVTSSMMREAERMLAALPADGRDMYELRYGAKAKQLLSEATKTNDRELLVQLSRKYLLTEAGMDGTIILAQLNLSEGRAVAAMSVLRRLATNEVARKKYGSSLLLMLAEAESLGGNLDAAVEHLAAAVQLGGKLSLAVPPENPVRSGNEAAWLEDQFGSFDESLRSGLGASRERSNWIARGGEAGLGAGDGSVPLSRIRWKVEAVTSRPQQRLLESYIADHLNQVPPPSWQPIKVGSQLLMRTTERLMSIDFETGIRIWEYPWSNGPTSEDDRAIDIEQLGNLDGAEDLLIQKVWNDLPYGRLTSDGQRVYLLEDLGAIESVSLAQFGMPGNRANRPADNSSNTLVALDLSAEGKLVWIRGRNGIEPSEKSLANAFFLGPPLPVAGKLHQLAELTGDIYLICIEPETGIELWRQQILGNDGTQVISDPMRRIAGATPAASNGILVCPTGAGAVVAIDLVSRTLLWGHKLPTTDTNNPYMRSRNRYNTKPSQLDLMNRWLDGTPTICGSAVLVTPVESDRLYAFDLLTGEPLWSPILRNDFRYLAGCRGEQFFLVSGSRMQAFDLKSGQPTWAEPAVVGDNEQVSGTGLFGDDSYFLPTSSGALLEVELTTGNIRSRREVGFGLGNLLADGDSLISQTGTALSAAYAERPLRNMVQQRLDSDPDDRWAMVRQGELLLEAGQREEAIEWLLKARKVDSQDEEVRMLLVDALLTSIRNGRKPDSETTALLDELIELTPQRIELLRLKAIAALGEHRPVDVVSNLVELSSLLLHEEMTFRNEAPNFQSSPKHRTFVDAWTAASLSKAISIADEEEYRAIQAMVSEHLMPKVTQMGSIRRRALAQFATSLAVDPLRSATWSAAIDDGEFGKAERICLDAILLYERLGDRAASYKRQWLARLASTYQRTGFDKDALAYARMALDNPAPALAEKDTDGPLETSVSALQLLGKDIIAELETMTQLPQWPIGVKLTVADDPTRSNNMGQRQKNGSIAIQGLRSLEMENWLPRMERGAILLRDPLGYEHRIDVQGGSTGNEMVQVTIDGGLMILLTQEELIAVDLLSLQLSEIDPVLWRRRWWNQGGIRSVVSRSESSFFQDTQKSYIFSGDRRSSGSASGVMRLGPIVGRRFFALLGQDLTAIDLVTGEELWKVNTNNSDGFVVADSTRVGVVSKESGVRVFEYDDGEEIKTDVWEPSEILILSAGKNILTLRTVVDAANSETGAKESTRRTVRLVSPLDGKELLATTIISETNAFPNAYARLVDGRYMFLLTAEGRLVFWDLLEGKQICDQELDTGGKLTGFNVLRNQRGFVLALVRHEDRQKNADPTRQLYVVEGQEHVETDGPLIAIDPQDGSILWQYDLEGTWGISIYQPAASPLIFLSKSEIQFTDTSKGSRTLDVQAIDMRDGESAGWAKQTPIDSKLSSVRTDVQVQPEQNLVEVSVNRYVFLFKFENEVVAKEQRTLDSDTLKKMLEENRLEPGPMQLRSLEMMVPPRQ